MTDSPTSVVQTPSVPADEQALMDLSVTLAHRIRSLVAGIEGYTDLLTHTLGTSEQREMALRIFEGAARIERILGDLQLYGQPIEPLPVRVAVEDVINGLLNFLEEQDAGRVAVEYGGSPEACVQADPGLIRQGLLSLVRNALEATKAGKVRICVSGGTKKESVQIDVWNEGSIPTEDADTRLFIPFFTTKAQNLGIGLPVARRIAQAHGGTLMLTENSDVFGTCFSFSIPAQEV
jgi:two-component system, NtrC family, sensor histidine kinase HydH